jgi:SMC interacting uncharacterized protein involved in chromosome segregation
MGTRKLTSKEWNYFRRNYFYLFFNHQLSALKSNSSSAIDQLESLKEETERQRAQAELLQSNHDRMASEVKLQHLLTSAYYV